MCATCIENFKAWCNRQRNSSSYAISNPAYYDIESDGDDFPLFGTAPTRKSYCESLASLQSSAGEKSYAAAAGLCSFAQVAALRIYNTRLNDSLYIACALYTFFITFVADLEDKQCGIEGQKFTAFNTMFLTITTMLLWLVCFPLQKKLIASGLKNRELLFEKKYVWMKELEDSMIDTLCALDFVSYLADRFHRNQSSVKIILYCICCRGVVKGLVLIFGEVFVKKNQRWILQRFEELLLDNTFVRAINSGVSFAASLTCAVVTAINYIINARQDSVYARQEDDALWAAIVGFGVGTSITMLDSLYKTDFSSGFPRPITGAAEKKGLEKSMSFLAAAGMLCNLFYYYVNIVVGVAMCSEGEPLSPDQFKSSANSLDGGLGVMMVLGGIAVIGGARYPAASLLATRFEWPHEQGASVSQKLKNFAAPFRYAFASAFGAMLPVDKTSSAALDKALKSTEAFFASGLWRARASDAEMLILGENDEMGNQYENDE